MELCLYYNRNVSFIESTKIFHTFKCKGIFKNFKKIKLLIIILFSSKYMDHLPLCLINAHFAIMSGTYRYALVEYMNCFKQNQTDPFINLIIAITYCHISCQKYNTKRHLLVSQVFY